jgi:hypothetical protein
MRRERAKAGELAYQWTVTLLPGTGFGPLPWASTSLVNPIDAQLEWFWRWRPTLQVLTQCRDAVTRPVFIESDVFAQEINVSSTLNVL